MAHEFYNLGVRVLFRGENKTELQQVMHVFHVKTPDTPSVLDCQNIANVFANWWNTDYKTAVHSDWQANDVVAVSMASMPGPLWQVPINLSGTQTGNSAPASVTMAIKWSTDMSGRRRHGRWYPWPTSETQITKDKFNDLYVSNMLIISENLRGLLGTAGYLLGIWSGVDVVIYPALRAEVTDTIIDNQRRRLPGRGR